LINNIWIINKTTSVCLLQKSYENQTKQLDNDLFSGFMTAIFNFSKEISDFGESVHSISMGRTKFFYQSTENIIVVVSTDRRINEILIEPVMERIITEFQKKGYEALVTKRVQEIGLFEDFKAPLDNIVHDAEKTLGSLITEEDAYIIEQKISPQQRSPILKAVQASARTETEKAELQALEENVIEAIENAEQAISEGDIQGSIIYYGVAAGLFQRLGENEKAELCNNMIRQAKEVLSKQEAKVIFTFDERLNPIIQELNPILPFELIQDLQLKESLQLAFNAELNRNYGEAMAFYRSAANRFLELNESQLAEKCNERIQQIFKRQQYEEKAAIATMGGEVNQTPVEYFDPAMTPEPTELKLLIPEEKIPDEEIKAYLMNGALSESINSPEKAISFYVEAANKFRFYEDEHNASLCQVKIDELREKINVQQQISEIAQGKEIFPYKDIAEAKILKQLKSAQELEKEFKFSQAALKYNLASGMLSLKKDKKMKKYAKICTERAKILTRLKEYV